MFFLQIHLFFHVSVIPQMFNTCYSIYNRRYVNLTINIVIK